MDLDIARDLLDSLVEPLVSSLSSERRLMAALLEVLVVTKGEKKRCLVCFIPAV